MTWCTVAATCGQVRWACRTCTLFLDSPHDAQSAASTDETVHIIPHPSTSSAQANNAKPIPPIAHPTAVRAILPLGLTPLAEPYLLTAAGEVIRVYDVSTPAEPELLSETDGHWHDVTALRLWIRRTAVSMGIRCILREWISVLLLSRDVR